VATVDDVDELRVVLGAHHGVAAGGAQVGVPRPACMSWTGTPSSSSAVAY
jgi:hypothetical protein